MEPSNVFIENYEFNFLVIASGKRVPIEGFDRQSLDAQLAIAVTANFVNNRTAEDSEPDEIAGLSYQYHQVCLAFTGCVRSFDRFGCFNRDIKENVLDTGR